jgi:FtsP/CotA-like multicopper oxidase with cupredoxin domain
VNRRSLSAKVAPPLISVLAACATSQAPPASPVPESLRAPQSQVLAIEVHASGVQIYDCRPAKGDPTRFEWTLRAPEADLSDRTGKAVGKHYAGPTWEAKDGSKVIGEVIARDSGPDPAAIPWLLLRATSATGTGIFAQIQSIQRLRTVGGKAPADGCTETQSGGQRRVPYTADYLFYR